MHIYDRNPPSGRIDEEKKQPWLRENITLREWGKNLQVSRAVHLNRAGRQPDPTMGAETVVAAAVAIQVLSKPFAAARRVCSSKQCVQLYCIEQPGLACRRSEGLFVVDNPTPRPRNSREMPVQQCACISYVRHEFDRGAPRSLTQFIRERERS